MESKKITQHPWKSMKDRYLKHIIDKETLLVDKVLKMTSTSTPMVGVRQRHPYTSDEDNAIVHYVDMYGKEYGERGSVKGNLIWKQMQQNDVTSHSWQSMKDRYLKYL